MPKLALEKLKSSLVAMGEMCEYAVSTAMMSLLDRDRDLACYVIDYDKEIDEIELSIDRQCQTLLLSGKLERNEAKFVITASKINNDLERIGDQAAHICEHVLFLVQEKSILAQVVDFMPMIEQVCEMTRESINALLESDTTLAWKIIDERRIVQDEMRMIFQQLTEIMRKNERNVERACHILFIAQSLHRVADQASNIAEDVIFTTEGKVVRHHLDEYHPIPILGSSEFGEAEMAQAEKEAIKTRAAREDLEEQLRKRQGETVCIAKEIIEAQAEGAKEKALSARERLLRHQANKRK